MTVRCTVLLADDHPLLRAGVRAQLERIPWVTVVGEVEDGPSAVAETARLKPDVVLLDISMPGANGLEALEQITRTMPATKVVMLTMYPDEEYMLRAMRTGASGYVLKNSRADELHLAIDTVWRGERFVTPVVAARLVDYVSTSRQGSQTTPALTPRQREILILIATSHTTKVIADTLGISVKTVEMHRARLMERLNVRDIAGLVRHAVRTGLVDQR